MREWNDWSADTGVMRRDAEGGFSLTVDLDAGRAYRFRYLLDGRRWDNDWGADAYVRNDFGEELGRGPDRAGRGGPAGREEGEGAGEKGRGEEAGAGADRQECRRARGEASQEGDDEGIARARAGRAGRTGPGGFKVRAALCSPRPSPARRAVEAATSHASARGRSFSADIVCVAKFGRGSR